MAIQGPNRGTGDKTGVEGRDFGGSGGPSGGRPGAQPGGALDPSYEKLTREPVAPGGGGVGINRVGRNVPDGSTNFDPMRSDENLGNSDFGTPDQRAFNRRTQDYYGVGDGFLDSIGSMISKAFAFTDKNPMTETAVEAGTPAAPGPSDAYTNWDPIKTALQIGSFFNPMLAALNFGYTALNYATGLSGPQVTVDSPASARPAAALSSRGPSIADAQGRPITGVDSGRGRPQAPAQPRGATPARAVPTQTVDLPSLAAPFAALLDPTGRGRVPGQVLGTDTGLV